MIIARTILRSFIGTGIITVLVLGIASSSAFANEKAKGLQGSWRVTITGGAGTPVLPSWYQALVTFGADGGLVATITDPFLNTGHGAWGKKEKNTFAVTILLFQFNPEGLFLGTLKARTTLSLNEKLDTFDSDDYQFEFFDSDGQPTGFVGIGAAHGTRIKVEPLP
jgi:hypothetical protein